MTYSGTEQIVADFNTGSDKSNLINLITNAPYLGGPTDTVGALDDATLKLFERASSGFRGQNGVAVVITDGISDESVVDVHTSAVALQGYTRKVFAIGVGADISNSDLQAISSSAADVYLGDANGLDSLAPATLVAALGAVGSKSTTPTPAAAQQQGTGSGKADVPGNGNGSSSSTSNNNVPIILGEI